MVDAFGVSVENFATNGLKGNYDVLKHVAIDTKELRRLLVEWKNQNTVAGAAIAAKPVLQSLSLVLDALDASAATIQERDKEIERMRAELSKYKYAAAEIAGANSTGVVDDAKMFIHFREIFRSLQRGGLTNAER